MRRKIILPIALLILAILFFQHAHSAVVLYTAASLPLNRAEPPWALVPLYKVDVFQNYNTWFCSYVYFDTTTWNYDQPATMLSGYMSLSGATGITSLTSTFNNVDPPVVTGSSAAFNATIAPYQPQLDANELLKFELCGAKDETTNYDDIKWTGYLVVDIDLRPPPIPGPLWTPFPLGPQGPVNDCFGYLDPDLQDWDVILFGDLLSVTGGIIGGRIIAGGDVIVNSLYQAIGSNVQSCGTCGSSTSFDDASVVAGGYVVFYQSSPGLCQGFFQGAKNISTQSVLSVAAGCPQVVDSELPINMDQVQANMTLYSQQLSLKLPTGNTGYAINPTLGGALSLVFNSLYDDFIFFVPGAFVSTDGAFVLDVLNPDSMNNATNIIFNIDGSTVTLNLNFSGWSGYEDKVIFNFYEATSVTIGTGIFYGTILAPLATLTVQGTSKFYGQIIAESLTVDYGSIFAGEPRWVGYGMSDACLTCATGYWGSECKKCNCTYNEICSDGVNGDGTCTCMPNFDAKCFNCTNGWYGSYCNNSCVETCVLRGTCSYGLNGTGKCLSCVSPFNGTNCDTCINTVWGPDCNKDCDSICFTKGGSCDFGVNGTGLCASCGSPWANGPQDMCEICDNSHYGSDCTEACVATCAQHGNCSHGFNGTGACLDCLPTFQGDECQQCIANVWGSDCQNNCTQTCLTYGICNDGITGTGSCSACTLGTTGSQCNECTASGAYGPNCTLHCNSNCVAHGKCSSGPAGTGQCLSCVGVYYGANCQFKNPASAATLSMFSIAFLIMMMMLMN